MKNSEFVDLVIVQIKANNVDEVPPRRFILKSGRAINTTLISQKLLDRTLTRETTLYTTINCVEFEKSDRIKCPIADLRRCSTLMKSKKPIPDPLFSRLGSSIRNIRSIDDSFSFSMGYQEEIRKAKHRKYIYEEDIIVYLGADKHLYIPDHEIYLLSLDVLTLETEDCECEDNCKSAWEYEFKTPDRYLMNVVDLTTQKLLTWKQLPQDQNPNNVVGA